MAKQMEIHPDYNDVINATESTLRHAWESLYMLAAMLIQVCANAHVLPQKKGKKCRHTYLFGFLNLNYTDEL